MDEHKQVEQAVMKMMREAGGSVAVQTVGYVVQKALREDGEMTIRSAVHYLKIVASYAQGLADAPETWSYKGHFSEALADYCYKPVSDSVGIRPDLLAVVKKLDTTYGTRFLVESAVSYLQEVTRISKMLADELKKERE